MNMNKNIHTVLLLVFFTWPAVVWSDAEEDYERLREQIYFELHDPVGAQETQTIRLRRQRLRQYFSDIPREFAAEFRAELGSTSNGFEFSETFHGKLASSVRRELLEILEVTLDISERVSQDDKTIVQSQAVSQVPFLGFGPLPYELDRQLEIILNSLHEPLSLQDPVSRERLVCAINKLSDMSVDDRIIKWRHICPSEFGIGAPFVISCPAVSFKITQEELRESIKSVSDIPSAGSRHRFISHLRSLLVFLAELDVISAEVLRDIHDQIILTHSYLEKITTASHGGGSKTPAYYVHIKNWLWKKQKNSDSVLSCFRE